MPAGPFSAAPARRSRRPSTRLGPDRSATTAYFEDKIASVTTAEDLVADRRLLSVALGAFGLDGDINSKFFVQKVLRDGTLERRRRWPTGWRTSAISSSPRPSASTDPGEPKPEIRFRRQDHRRLPGTAVRGRGGRARTDLRLAMGLCARRLARCLDSQTTDDGRWFAVMGNPPLRHGVRDRAGPAVELRRARPRPAARRASATPAERVFGDGEVAQFDDPAVQEKLIRLFLVAQPGAAEPSTIARPDRADAAAVDRQQEPLIATPAVDLPRQGLRRLLARFCAPSNRGAQPLIPAPPARFAPFGFSCLKYSTGAGV